ncbi:hypothetical protein BZG36_04405 [Bifiguratus adelaidae]|uniref:non-specific serine/threonine protein kinase n=1 Tax=Bifiguratus adelaidae TaxID=1938954 RepID=A0A261XWA9_9FUNG|nr:hypothetical protein BZG36_04405 [Bifiguratus adelaidae]
MVKQTSLFLAAALLIASVSAGPAKPACSKSSEFKRCLDDSHARFLSCKDQSCYCVEQKAISSCYDSCTADQSHLGTYTETAYVYKFIRFVHPAEYKVQPARIKVLCNAGYHVTKLQGGKQQQAHGKQQQAHGHGKQAEQKGTKPQQAAKAEDTLASAHHKHEASGSSILATGSASIQNAAASQSMDSSRAPEATSTAAQDNATSAPSASATAQANAPKPCAIVLYTASLLNLDTSRLRSKLDYCIGHAAFALMDNYELLEVIGSGVFGKIYKAQRKSDGKILAAKEIDYRKMEEAEKLQLVQEVNILRELRHPYIVRYYERIVDKHNFMIYIIMEYCEGGDLAALIKRCKVEGKHLQEEAVWILLTQLLMAINECHAGRYGRTEDGKPSAILHRDLKPDNVFLDAERNIKLGDFGLSKTLAGDADFAKTTVGTPYYMSPEIVNESTYDAKSDIWALGCLVYELCALVPPFRGNTKKDLARKIQTGAVPPLPRQYSSELFDLIKLMLHPEKRPSAVAFFEHDRIKLTMQKIEIVNYQKMVKKHAAEVKKKEVELQQREEAIMVQEAELYTRLQKVKTKEDKLRLWESTLKQRELLIAQHLDDMEDHRTGLATKGTFPHQTSLDSVHIPAR